MRFILLLPLAYTLLLTIGQVMTHAAEHPRLLVTSKDIPALRSKIRTEPFAKMYAQLQKQVAQGINDEDGSLAKAALAHQNAFCYLLSNDDRYATQAKALVNELINDRTWANKGVKGLSLYNQGAYVALTYDHCYGAPSWDKEFSATVSAKLRQQAEVIMRSGGREQNPNAASNWQGLRWSSAGLCLMASDEPITDPKAIDACYRRVIRYLQANLSTDPNARGWNCEGLGYTYYPMGNGVCPFLIAMHRADPKYDARKDVPAMQWTLWTCFAALVKTPTGLWRPDFGDDNPGTRGEGCYGFSFWFAPPEIRPGLKWWYDRTLGTQGDQTFDHERFGNVSSILYYPADEPAKDPMTLPAWRSAMTETGGNGYVTFRNHYRDESDIACQLYAKLRGNRGHNGPDALSFRIVGLGTIWGTGGGRYGEKTNGQDVYLRSQNTVYPGNPDSRLAINGNSGRWIGQPKLSSDGGGIVEMQIPQNNVGAKNHTRRFLADFSLSGAAAAFVVDDVTSDGKFWQFVTLASNTVSISGQTFVIQSPDGATLQGTVLYPTSAVLHTGVRPRGSPAGEVTENRFVTVEGNDGRFVVAMTLAPRGAKHPEALVKESPAEPTTLIIDIGKLRAKAGRDSLELAK